jgi:ABC-type transporter Mla subunit MlaD
MSKVERHEEKPNLQQAASEIGNMVRAFRAFSEAQNALDTLANYEQVARESKDSANAARGELVAASASLEKAKAEAADAKDSAKSMLANAKDKAAAIVGDAEAKTAAMVAEVQSKINELNDQAYTLTEKLASLRSTIVEEEGRLEGIRQRAAAAKDAARKAFEEA